MALSYSEISRFLEEASKTKPLTEGSFTIGPGHNDAKKGQKIYNKGKGSTNPNEKDTFLKRTGPQLPPLAQKKPSTQMAGYQPEGELIEETDMRFCPKCEKMEVKEECAYGPDYWDTFAIKNVSQKVEEGIVTTALAVGAGGYAAYKGLKHLKKKGDEALDNARQNSQIGAGTRQRKIEKSAGVKSGTLDPNMQRLNVHKNSYEPEGELLEKEYKVGDTIDNSDGIKDNQKRRMDTLNRILKDNPKNWNFSQKNVDKRIVTGESTELDEGSAAWQRSEGKNKKGGLNEKGRKSYERENPGSDLKAPQPEGGPRKRSFCARMGGMKGAMKKPNGEPTRKALALRKWKC